MTDISEDEAIPLRNLATSTDATSPDSEEATDTAPFVRQPITQRVINVPWLLIRLRRAVHFTLDHTPMPAETRGYLKNRWYGVFLSAIIFLTVAVAIVVATVILVGHKERSAEAPVPEFDPFADWAKDMGPNDRTIFRLADTVIPIDYRIFFYFHMDDTSQRYRYQGRVAITIEVTTPLDVIDRFLIHAHRSLDIDFKNFIIVDHNSFVEEMTSLWESFPYIDTNGKMRVGTESILQNIPDEREDFGRYEIPQITRLDDDTLEVKVTRAFEGEAQKMLLVQFNGTMRENPPGIFVNKVPNSEDIWLATQFQPSLAQAAFPCFDELGFRAGFQISLAHPKKYIALSNMPSAGSRPISYDTADGYVWTTFSLSVRMPPYLVGFVVGPFRSLEVKRTRNVPETKLYALHQEDLRERTVFAANVTVQALEYCKKYFQLDFPMPKLYLVAVPSKQPIDSEAWGLILYREDAILLNTSTATVASLEKVARNVVHYIIHQYVGNMVGPAWWDDLWATEALIGFLENEFLEKIFPEWDVWENFATITIGEALKIDLLEGKHAVFALPRIPYYPMTMFDALTSHKGAAIFRMLEMYSPGCVQTAVQTYLTSRMGRSVSANVLFQELHYAIYASNASLEDGPPIVDVVKKWTRETAYPLVTVIRYSNTEDVSLFQEVFTPLYMINQMSLESHEISQRKCHYASRHQRVPGSTTAWSLPIDFRVLNDTTFIQVDSFWQTTNYHRVCGGFPNRTKLIIGNEDQKGFFRMDYDMGNWELIGHEMMHNPKVFSRVTRAMLIDDAMAMAKLSRIKFAEALMMPMALLHQGVGEDLTAGDVGMYERAMRAVADVHDCLRGSKLEPDMLDYMRLIVSAQWTMVDPPQRRKFEKTTIRNHTDVLGKRTSILLQEQAIFWACYTGMPECTDWAVELVEDWQESHPSKEEDVIEEHYSNAYCAAVRYGPDSYFDFLWSRYTDGDLSEMHKKEILWALLCTKRQEKLLQLFGGLPGKRAVVEDTMKMWKKMEDRHISAWYAFKYERTYWNNIHSNMFSKSFFSQIIVAITSALSTPDDLEDIQNFRKEHNESLWNVQEELEVNVHNIRKRLFFRSVIEEDLRTALKEMTPLVHAVKLQTDNARTTTPYPKYGVIE